MYCIPPEYVIVMSRSLEIELSSAESGPLKLSSDGLDPTQVLLAVEHTISALKTMTLASAKRAREILNNEYSAEDMHFQFDPLDPVDFVRR
jgi:hypothetical protein